MKLNILEYNPWVDWWKVRNIFLAPILSWFIGKKDSSGFYLEGNPLFYFRYYYANVKVKEYGNVSHENNPFFAIVLFNKWCIRCELCSPCPQLCDDGLYWETIVGYDKNKTLFENIQENTWILDTTWDKEGNKLKKLSEPIKYTAIPCLKRKYYVKCLLEMRKYLKERS